MRFTRLRSLFRRNAAEIELNEELRYHLERQIEENIARGMTPSHARYAALKAFGSVEQWKEGCRDMRGFSFIDDLIRDVRLSLRTLRASPSFAAVAVLTLALGIGSNAAVFGLMHPLLFPATRYPRPSEIARVFRTSTQDSWPHSVPDFLEYRERNTTFSSLAAYTWSDCSIGDGEKAAVRGSGML